MTTAHAFPMHRTSQGAIVATLLAALLSLVVLLQWLPTISTGVSDAGSASSTGLDPLTAQVLPLFIGAAVAVIVAVTAVLLDRSRHRTI